MSDIDVGRAALASVSGLSGTCVPPSARIPRPHKLEKSFAAMRHVLDKLIPRS
jgi:hypothetical protein